MKKLLFIGVLVLLSSCQNNNIAYVDYAELIDAYNAKKELDTNLQQKAQTFARKRDSISQMFQIEAQSFQQRAQTMNQNKAQEEYNQLQTRGQQIGQQLQMEEQRLQEEGNQKMDSLISLVRSKLSAYGESKGLDYILAAGEGGSVLYGAEAQDITKDLIQYLNEEEE